MVRPTYAEIDLGAIADNVSALATLVAPSVLCAVVKADAYGHGDAPVAATALGAGAGWLAVALIEEGVRLREAGIEAPILVLSEPGPDAVGDVVEWGLTPSVYSARFVSALGKLGVPVSVHLKVDTGMHRVGAHPDQLARIVEDISGASWLEVAAVWTHFSVADDDPDYTRAQIRCFDDAVVGVATPMQHMANTAGAILFPTARRDMCRVGLGIYGLHPCDATRDVIELRPAMRLVTQVVHVQRLRAGERPSYGRRRPLAADATVATVPVGYADGLARSLSRDGEALIRGRRHPFAGTITMDQTVVDVGDSEVEVGDEVVLLGAQGGQEVSADDWATVQDTISYEVVCSIGPRVPRRYRR